MKDRWYWRCCPDQRYRAFPLGQPAVAAVVDGVRVLACPSILDLARCTPVPVYRPDTGEIGILEVTDEDHFAPTVLQDDRGYYAGGEEIPRDIIDEMLEWAEEFVRAHPDTPLIPRQTGNVGHHGYQTTKSVIYTFNTVYQNENIFREQYDPGLRGAPPDRDHVAQGDRTKRGAGAQKKQRGESPLPLDMAR